MLKRLRQSYLKNRAELGALLTGRMPDFVYGARRFRDIPVFCFHSARYPEFEHQLHFLKRNGYRTLDATELHERLCDTRYRNDGKEIVLTFDDGMASVWTVAYPLLQKYEFKIISFILPGLIEAGDAPGETIDDVDMDDRETLARRDYSSAPLCNWREIEVMHGSGLVDFQSHGMYHALVAVSSHIVDFINPDFDAYHYGNIHVPVYRDEAGRESREAVLGHPVYESRPRLSGHRRYLDPYGLRAKCADYVERRGGRDFFKKPTWRAELRQLAEQYCRTGGAGDYETEQEMRQAMSEELSFSKRKLAERLGKEVTHFCFPWFAACEQSMHMACEAGYRSVHLGASDGFRRRQGVAYPLAVHRLQEEYLMALPGVGRRSLAAVLLAKARRRG